MCGGFGRSLKAASSAFAFSVRFLLRLAAELGDEPAAARRQNGDAAHVGVLVAHELDELVVHRLEPDRAVIADEGGGVSRLIDVREGKERDGALWRAVNEVQRGFEDSDAGSFRADQRARDVEAVLGEKFVEIVTGDAARDFRDSCGG